MKTHRIHTDRLDLIPATREMFTCDLLKDYRELERLLDAEVPGTWPPRDMTKEVLCEFIHMASKNSDPFFSDWYWVKETPDAKDRILIGNGGTGSAPNKPGTAVIGYSVLDNFCGQGYATEAVRSLIPAIFSDCRVSRIVATTFPELKASIRVLEKTGFVCTGKILSGEGREEGTLEYVLKRPHTAFFQRTVVSSGSSLIK